ncbi:hypothetical protein IWX90DRAFT_482196 [Phyllosticta citrichinensis]|uniref:Uncharacterized protein n=1 Tax=Phyllosticta citrichinensis TaxID=1130410 RepID=A0ABR1Y5W2_9PEZI
MICYLHKDIESQSLREQVRNGGDYAEILGHPVVVLAIPAARSDEVFFAKVTTFGGKTAAEKFGSSDKTSRRFQREYLPISHGGPAQEEGFELQVEKGRRMGARSWVNIGPKNVLRIETRHLPPFRRTTKQGVEYALTADSLQKLMEHYWKLASISQTLGPSAPLRFGCCTKNTATNKSPQQEKTQEKPRLNYDTWILPSRIAFLPRVRKWSLLAGQVREKFHAQVAGHPVIIMSAPNSRGVVAIALLTSLGGQTVQEKYSKVYAGNPDRAREFGGDFLLIKHGDTQPHDDTPLLRLKDGKEMGRRSYVNVAYGNFYVQVEDLALYRKNGSGKDSEVFLDEASFQELVIRKAANGGRTTASRGSSSKRPTILTYATPRIHEPTNAAARPTPFHDRLLANSHRAPGISPRPTKTPATKHKDALFNFQSLLLVILLLVCTSTYLHAVAPGLLDRNKDGVFGIFWKFARVGERLSPYVSLCCVVMAGSLFMGA